MIKIKFVRFPSDCNKEIASRDRKQIKDFHVSFASSGKREIPMNSLGERFRGRDKIKIINTPCEVGSFF